jgi:hypothetical protein
MAATADPRAKPPAATPHRLEPWAHQPPAVAAHRMPVIPVVSSPGSARDRRRPSSHRRGGAGQDVGEETRNGGIERLRAKLMGHLRYAADRLRVPQPTPSLPPPPPETDSEPEPELRAPPPPPLLPSPPPQLQPSQGADVAVPGRPWNLRERTRRRPAAAKSWAASAPPSSSSLRRRRKRAPFSVSLTAEEIEEDIYALTGARPRRRPRKRPRVVQRQLDVRRIPRAAPALPIPPNPLLFNSLTRFRFFTERLLAYPPPH